MNRWQIICQKTGRFWDRGLASYAMAQGVAIGLGLKDYAISPLPSIDS